MSRRPGPDQAWLFYALLPAGIAYQLIVDALRRLTGRGAR